VFGAAAAGALALALAVPSLAYWTSTSSAGGSGQAASGVIPTGAQPTASAAGARVTVSWPQSSIPTLGALGSIPGGGYVVTRYPDGSPSGVLPASGCAGLVSGAAASLSCTENGVTEGRWRYTVTPRLNAWPGTAGPASLTVVVDLTPPATSISLVPALNAAGWSNLPVVITLSAVDNTGGAGVASISYGATGAQVVPTSTYTAPFTIAAEGATILSFGAVDKAGNNEATKTQVVRIDRTPPTGAILSPAPGAIRSGVTTVIASSADALSGVASAGFQLAPDLSTTWTAFGTATAAPFQAALDTSTLADGRYYLRVVTTDRAGNAFTSPSVSVIVDNRAPSGIDVQGANGGLLGTIDPSDSVTYTFSEPIAPGSIIAGWNGAPQPVTATFRRGNRSGDRLTVAGASLGTVRLGEGTHWLGGKATFQATLSLATPNAVILTLGSCATGCTGLTAGVGPTTFTWVPSTTTTDLAGNRVSANRVTQVGGPKPNF
jgi:hypothetical protein